MALTGSNAGSTGDIYAMLAYLDQRDGDNIPDDCMSEIVRRLIVAIEQSTEAALYRGVSPPTDITLLWQPTDASDVPIGGTMVYDPSTSTWVPTTDTSLIASQQVRAGNDEVSANGAKVINIGDPMPSSGFFIQITPCNWDGSAFAGVQDTGALWYVSARDVTSFTLTFSNVTGTFYFFWRVVGL